MPAIFDYKKMEKLLESFHKITAIRYSLADVNNNLLCFSNDFTDFCKRMNSCEQGHRLCIECDALAQKRVKNTKERYYTYRCHAGLIETIIPIYSYEDNIVAYILLGQMVAPDNIDRQWEVTESKIRWNKDFEKLKQDFKNLTVIEEEKISASAEILIACSSYIWAHGVSKSAPETDFQTLVQYIDQNYAKPLTLDEIAGELHFSKTKLCNIATKNKTTVVNMLTKKRIEQAQHILTNTDLFISEVGQLVGITDYNYFTKLFKSRCSLTPRQYRKTQKSV